MFLKRGGMAMVLAAVLCAGCQSTKYVSPESPTPQEMKTALTELLKAHPEYSLPEFELSLQQAPVVHSESMVRIGAFECDPQTLLFDASYSAPNLPLNQLVGRFEQDVQRQWKARVLRSRVATAPEPNRRYDWYPSDAYSWSRGGYRR